MASINAAKIIPYLFSFRVRNLPETILSLLVSEVEIITDKIQVNPVPLTRPEIYGICYLDQHLITVLDLAAVLRRDSNPSPLLPGERIMVAKVPVQGDFQYLGWPIEGDANIVELTGVVYRSSAPLILESKLIEESLSMENNNVVILRLQGLFDEFDSPSAQLI
jgi:chemotaxis signal transduction protein